MWTQELDSMILVVPFQIKIFFVSQRGRREFFLPLLPCKVLEQNCYAFGKNACILNGKKKNNNVMQNIMQNYIQIHLQNYSMNQMRIMTLSLRKEKLSKSFLCLMTKKWSRMFQEPFHHSTSATLQS